MLTTEQKRHDALVAGLGAALEILGEEATNENTIIASKFLWELLSDHKRQRAGEALEPLTQSMIDAHQNGDAKLDH